MISRRACLISVAVLITPLEVVAQQQNAVPRVGVLAQDIQPGLLETLQRLGYVEGKDIVTDVRNADGRSDRLPALVADLLRLGVDVIVAVNTPAATKTVPIVIMRVADPVAIPEACVTALPARRFDLKDFAEAGGLFAYGPDLDDVYRARRTTWLAFSGARSRVICLWSRRIACMSLST